MYKQMIASTEVEVTNVIENIQQEIIEAGGRFFKQKEIRQMSVEELLTQLLPNHIVFTVKYVPIADIIN